MAKVDGWEADHKKYQPKSGREVSTDDTLFDVVAWRERQDEAQNTGVGVSRFAVSADISALGVGQSVYLTADTNGKDATFTSFNIASSQDDISFEFFEAPTVSVNGSALSAKDLDRQADEVPTMLTFAGSTVTSDGVLLMKHHIPNQTFILGGESWMTERWKLKKNTTYSIKITNNSGSGVDITANFYWSEK